MSSPPPIPARSIVVVMPSWLGDGVMATPFLRALRAIYPAARIAATARPLVAPVLAGLPCVDQVEVCAKGREAALARWMRGERFDLGILLPNSFRTAWMLWRGGVRRRLGYARGGRSWLLTDKILPMPRTAAGIAADQKKTAAIRAAGGNARVHNAFEPDPTILYYLKLARYLDADTRTPSHDNNAMALGITATEHAEAELILAPLAGATAAAGEPRLVTLVPGANFGGSKCWLPERFAEVADLLADPAGPFAARVILAGSPSEQGIIHAIVAASRRKESLLALPELNGGRGISLGALKEIVRRSALMVCNDTGPRHFAAALGVPMVTLFGPTDPVWAETFAREGTERIVRLDVPCGPCQLKRCPIDHRCMKGITVKMVMAAIAELWPRGGTGAPPTRAAADWVPNSGVSSGAAK